MAEPTAINPIIHTPEVDWVKVKLEEQGMRSGAPGYAKAVKATKAQYETELDKALAAAPFETFAAHPSNKGLPEGVVRQAHEVLQQEFKPIFDGEAFAGRTGRRFDEASTYADGTAHLFPRVLDFYDKHVAHLPAKSHNAMPDALFRIGEASDSVTAGLKEFLPSFRDDLREARISARTIKHVHDSRPEIARDVLSKLERGVLQADEVLPNPQNRERALLVLKDIGHADPNKKGVTVIEVAANGKGIDVVSSMTSPERSLKKARELRKQMEASRSEGQQLGTKPNSPHPPLPVQGQTHAAADFPTVERDGDSVVQPKPDVNSGNQDLTGGAAAPHPRCLRTRSITRQPTFRSSAKP